MHYSTKGRWRFFSLFLSIVFLATNNSYAITSIQTKVWHPVWRPAINLPSEIGSIQESYSGSSDRFILYLQDAHSHPEAQWNNYRILESISKQFPVDTIFVEGTTGLVDTTPYLNLPDYEITLRTAENLLNKGYITGEEYFSLSSRQPRVITGIESPDLYRENINGLKDILRYKEENISKIKGLRLSLDSNRFNKELREFYNLYKGYSSGDISLSEYATHLTSERGNLKKFLSLLAIEKTIDFKVVNRERDELIDRLTQKLSTEEARELVSRSLEFRLHKITALEYYQYVAGLSDVIPVNLSNYLGYLKQYHELDRVKLLREIEEESEDILERLCQNKEEKALLKKLKNLDLIEKLLDTSLSPSEWAYFKKNKEDFGLEPLPLDFYKTAEERDTVLAENLIRHLDFTGTKQAVLITGGFHTEGITRRLRKRGISYIVMAPAITDRNNKNQEIYMKLLTKSTLKVQEQTQRPDFLNIFRINVAMDRLQGEVTGKRAGSAYRLIRHAVLGYIKGTGDNVPQLEDAGRFLEDLAHRYEGDTDQAKKVVAVIAYRFAGILARIINEAEKAGSLEDRASQLQGELPAGVIRVNGDADKVRIQKADGSDRLVINEDGWTETRYYLSKPVVVDGKWEKRYLGNTAKAELEVLLAQLKATGIRALPTDNVHVRYAFLTPKAEPGKPQNPYTMAIIEEHPAGERVLWTRRTPGLTNEQRYGRLLEYLVPLNAKPRTRELPSWREMGDTTTKPTTDYPKGTWGDGQAELDLARCDQCYECVDTCPEGALPRVDSGDFFRVLEQYCTGCGRCEAVCPLEPKAIRVKPKKELTGALVETDRGERTELSGDLVVELADTLTQAGLLSGQEILLGDFKARKAYYIEDGDVLQVELQHRDALPSSRPLVITFVRQGGQWQRAWLRQKKTILCYGMGELELLMVKELQKEGYSVIGAVDRKRAGMLTRISKSEWNRANNKQEEFRRLGLYTGKTLMKSLESGDVDVVVTGESSWLRGSEMRTVCDKTRGGLWVISPHNIFETHDKVLDAVMERLCKDVQEKSPGLWYKKLERAGYPGSSLARITRVITRLKERVSKNVFPGHRLCPACPQPMIVDSVCNAAAQNAAQEKKVVKRLVVVNTGCLTASGMSNFYGTTFRDPAMRILFGNAVAVASGIDVALKYLERMEKLNPDEKFEIIVFTGDGGDADIGLQKLLAAAGRGHKIRYFVFGNEAYMNTGGQGSGSTSFGAETKSTASGGVAPGKMVSPRYVPDYVAQHADALVIETNSEIKSHFNNALEKAFKYEGFVYCNVSSTCHTGQGYQDKEAVTVSNTRVHTGMSPLVIRDRFITNITIPPQLEKQDTETSLLKWLSKQDFARDLFKGEGDITDLKHKPLALLRYFQPVIESMKLEGRFGHLVDKDGKIIEGMEPIVYINQLDIILRLLRLFKDSEEFGDKYSRREYVDLIKAIIFLRLKLMIEWNKKVPELIRQAREEGEEEIKAVVMDEDMRRRNNTRLGKDVLNVEWFGFAGWGVQLASQMATDILHLLGLYPIGWSLFGPERTGAPVEGYNRASGLPIGDRSDIRTSQISMVFDEQHLVRPDLRERTFKALAKDGILFVNTSKSPEKVRRDFKIGNDYIIITADLSRIAEKSLGGRKRINIAGLAVFIKALELKGFEIDRERIRELIRVSAKKGAKKAIDKNLAAFDVIYENLKIEEKTVRKYELAQDIELNQASPITWKANTGNEVVSKAIVQSRYGVFAGYPITPSTTVGEYLSELQAKGLIDTEILLTESEDAAMAALIGSAGAGVLSVTSTSSQGLLLMHEALPVAAGLGLPIVMYVANREITRNVLSIYTGHSDTMLQLGTGWVQLYAKNNQELYDLMIIAPVLWKYLRAPIMVCGDGFNLSHTRELVTYLTDEQVREFQKEVEEALKMWEGTMGAGSSTKSYTEAAKRQHRRLQHDITYKKIRKVFDKYKKVAEREYDFVKEYGDKDAEVAIIVEGSSASTCEMAIEMARDMGIRAKVIDIKTIVPFPYKVIAEKIRGCESVIVLDRSMAPGLYPPILKEVQAADNNYNYQEKKRARIYGEIYGLGGRNPQPNDILGMIMKAVLIRGAHYKTSNDESMARELLVVSELRLAELEENRNENAEKLYERIYLDAKGEILEEKKGQLELAREIADLLLELTHIHVFDMKSGDSPFDSYEDEKEELIRYLREVLIEPLETGNYIDVLGIEDIADAREGIEDERNKRIKVAELFEKERARRHITASKSRDDSLTTLHLATVILNLSQDTGLREKALDRIRRIERATRHSDRSAHTIAAELLQRFSKPSVTLAVGGLTNIEPNLQRLETVPILRALPKGKKGDFTKGYKGAVERYLERMEQIGIPRLLGVRPGTPEYEGLKKRSRLSPREFDQIYIRESTFFLDMGSLSLENVLAGEEKGEGRTEGWAATVKVTVDEDKKSHIWPIIEKALVESAATREDFETIAGAVYHEVVETYIKLFIKRLGLGEIFTKDRIHEIARQLEMKNFGASRVSPYVSRARVKALEIEADRYGLPVDKGSQKIYIQNTALIDMEKRPLDFGTFYKKITRIYASKKNRDRVSLPAEEEVREWLDELANNGYSGVIVKDGRYKLAGLREVKGMVSDSVGLEGTDKGYEITGEVRLDPVTGLWKVYLGNEIIPALIKILSEQRDLESIAKIKAGGRAVLLKKEGYPLYLGIVWEGPNGDTLLWSREPSKESRLRDAFYTNYIDLLYASARKSPKPGFTKKGYEEYPPATILELEGDESSIYRRVSDWGTERAVIDPNACVGCDHCVYVCPRANIQKQVGEIVGVGPEHCDACGMCESVCDRLGHHAIRLMDKDDLSGVHQASWLQKRLGWQTSMQGARATNLYEYLVAQLGDNEKTILGDYIVTKAYSGRLPVIEYSSKDGKKEIGGEEVLQLRLLLKTAPSGTKPVVYTFIRSKDTGDWRLVVKPQRNIMVLGTGEIEGRMAIESIHKGFEVRVVRRFSPKERPVDYDMAVMEKYEKAFFEAGLWVDEKVVELVNLYGLHNPTKPTDIFSLQIPSLRQKLGTQVPDYLVTGELGIIDADIRRASTFLTGQPIIAPGEIYVSHDNDLDQIMDDIYQSTSAEISDVYESLDESGIERGDVARVEEAVCHFAGGHGLCTGCDAGVIAKNLIATAVTAGEKLNKKMRIVFVGATGCLEVATTSDQIAYGPKTGRKHKLQISYYHSLFDNLGASISGVIRAWEARKAIGEIPPDEELIVMGVGGDGGTHDIGLQALSGAWERGEKVFYVEYNNGAYMNTGIQRSSGTPELVETTTTPVEAGGKEQEIKDVPEILAAHMRDSKHLVMTGSTHNPIDFISKLEQGILHAITTGPAYLGIYATCVPGHRIRPEMANITNQIACETGTFISYTIKDGVLELTDYTPEVPEWDPAKKDYKFKYIYKNKTRTVYGDEYIERWEEFERMNREDGGRNIKWITARPVVDLLRAEGRYKHIQEDKAAINKLQQKVIRRLEDYRKRGAVTVKVDTILRAILDQWKREQKYEYLFQVVEDASELGRDIYADINPASRAIIGEMRRGLSSSPLLEQTESLESFVDTVERILIEKDKLERLRKESERPEKEEAKAEKEKLEIATKQQREHNRKVLSNELVTAWKSRGGRGAVSANKLLSKLFLEMGCYMSDFPFFSPERQGAPIEAFFVVSGREIRSLGASYEKNFTVVLDEKAWDEIAAEEQSGEELPRFLHGQAPDGVLLVNTRLTPEELRDKYNLYGRWKSLKIYTVDAGAITARYGGDPNKSNMTLLGATLRAYQYLGIQYNKEALFAKVAQKDYVGQYKEKAVKAFIDAHENILEEKDSPKTYEELIQRSVDRIMKPTGDPQGERYDGNDAAAKFWEQIAHNMPVVFATYPITPTTQVGELVAKIAVYNKKLGRKLLEYMAAESEHSALSACIAAALSGCVSGFATGSQGWLYALEAAAIADDLRAAGLIVYNGNRAVNAPLNILYDRSDADSFRHNWLEFVATNQQEVYDFGFIALLASYLAQRPAKIDYAAFFLTHTGSNVKILTDEQVKQITDIANELRKKIPNLLDNRISKGYVAGEGTHTERVMQEAEAMAISPQRAIQEAFRIFKRITGREHDFFKTHKTEDAEQIVAILGAHGKVVERAVDELREEEGIKVGLVWPKVNGPFVGDLIGAKRYTDLLGHAKLLQVIEHFNDAGKVYSPFASNIASAFTSQRKTIGLINWIMGLGGRTLDVKRIKELIKLGIILSGSPNYKPSDRDMQSVLKLPEARMSINRLVSIYEGKLKREWPSYTKKDLQEYRKKITGLLLDRDYLNFLGDNCISPKAFADVRSVEKELDVKMRLVKLIELTLAQRNFKTARPRAKKYLAKVLYYFSPNFHDQDRVAHLVGRAKVKSAALLCMDRVDPGDLKLTPYKEGADFEVPVYVGEEKEDRPHQVGYHAASIVLTGNRKAVALNPTYIEYVRKNAGVEVEKVINAAIFHETEEGKPRVHDDVLREEKEKYGVSPVDPAYSLAQHYAILNEVETYSRLPDLSDETRFIHQYYRRWMVVRDLFRTPFVYEIYERTVREFYESKSMPVPIPKILLSDLELFLRNGRLSKIGNIYLPTPEEGTGNGGFIKGMNHGVSGFAEAASGFSTNAPATFWVNAEGVIGTKAGRHFRGDEALELRFQNSRMVADLLKASGLLEFTVKKDTTKDQWMAFINRLLLINKRQSVDPYLGQAFKEWRETRLPKAGTVLSTLEALEDNICDASSREIIEAITSSGVRIAIAVKDEQDAKARLKRINFPITEGIIFITYTTDQPDVSTFDLSPDSTVLAYNDKLEFANASGFKAVKISHGVSLPQAFTFIIGMFNKPLADVVADLKTWLQSKGFSKDEIEAIVQVIPEQGIILPLPAVEKLTDDIQSDKSDQILISA